VNTGNSKFHARRVISGLDDVLVRRARWPSSDHDISFIGSMIGRHRPVAGSGRVDVGRHEARHVLVAVLVVLDHPRWRAVCERTSELDGCHVHVARQRPHLKLAPNIADINNELSAQILTRYAAIPASLNIALHLGTTRDFCTCTARTPKQKWRLWTANGRNMTLLCSSVFYAIRRMSKFLCFGAMFFVIQTLNLPGGRESPAISISGVWS